MYRIILILAFFVSVQSTIDAQSKQSEDYLDNVLDSLKTELKEPMPFFILEEKPEFPGGETALLNWISENTKYPEISFQNRISGRVYVEFVIEKTGEVTNVKIRKGVDPYINAEAIRVVKSMPKWKPGIQRGKTVPVLYMIPIKFSITNDNNRGKHVTNIDTNYFEVNKYYNMGLECYNKNDYIQAIEVFNKALSIAPNDKRSLYNRGLSYYYLNELEKACLDWIYAAKEGDKRSKETMRTFCSDDSAMLLYHQKAKEYFKNEEYSDSKKYYSLIMDLYPNDTIAIYNRALSNYKLGLFESACLDWKKLKIIGYEDGIEYYDKFCTDEALMTFYYKMAKEYMANDEYLNAIDYFNKIIRVVPNSASVYLSRAKAFYHISDTEMACSDIKKAIELGNEEAEIYLNIYCNK